MPIYNNLKIIQSNKKIFIIFLFLLCLTFIFIIYYDMLAERGKINKQSNLNKTIQGKDVRIFCMILTRSNSFLNNKVIEGTRFVSFHIVLNT